MVVFDGMVIDTNPGTNDAWGAVELNQKSGGFYGVTLAQLRSAGAIYSSCE